MASGKDAAVAADPSHRRSASKPEAAGSAGSAAAARQTLRNTQFGGWSPDHELTPGLHLVATPIGNLGDVTLRALWVLRNADRILCEDTRVTARLLRRFGIERPLEAYHDHNADRVRPMVLATLREGATLALVSDAGTPLVADPGYKLVRDALAEGLPVTAAPGPSAVLTALILSGLPPDRFLFAGFLPQRGTARRRVLAELSGITATLVFFEGRSRLAATLADMVTVLGNRPAAIGRELTKLHEEMRRGRLDALARHYRTVGPPLGEAVILIGPPEAAPAITEEEIESRLQLLLGEHRLRDAVDRLVAETGIARRSLYNRALALQRKSGAR